MRKLDISVRKMRENLSSNTEGSTGTGLQDLYNIFALGELLFGSFHLPQIVKALTILILKLHSGGLEISWFGCNFSVK